MRKTVLISAILLMATTTPGAAQTWSDGIYLRLFGGASLLRNDNATLSGVGSGSVDYNTGFAWGGAFGYDITRNISTELELVYRSANVRRFGNGNIGTGGDYASLAVMGNALYQFDGWDLGRGQRLRPFAGAGLGFVQEIDFDITGGAGAGGYSRNNRFAWQVRGGLNWELSRNWILSSELRYFGVGTPTLNGPAGRTLEAGYNTFDVLFGLTYRF